MNRYKKILTLAIVCGINAPAFAGCGTSRPVHPVSPGDVHIDVVVVPLVVQQETEASYQLRRLNQVAQVYRSDYTDFITLSTGAGAKGNPQLVTTIYKTRVEEHQLDLKKVADASALAEKEGNEELAKRAKEVLQQINDIHKLFESAYTKFMNARAAVKEEKKKIMVAAAKCKSKAKSGKK